jgi:hypothetical protein
MGMLFVFFMKFRHKDIEVNPWVCYRYRAI